MMFGSWNTASGYKHTGKCVLVSKYSIECPICLEIKLGISYPNRDHLICIDCFKLCYYGDYYYESQFPYPELEDEYDDNPDNPKWELNYPLITEYNEKWDEWDYNRETKYEEQKYLYKFGICRK